MFPSVNPRQSFPALESEVLKYWKENKTFQRSIEARPADNPYRFYDGPPFITGTPHYGSLLSSIVKDVVGRYWTMRGKRVDRVWGWDCHGLPIEEKVQKKLGLKSNKEIEAAGVKTFIDECYKYTKETSDEWEWYIDHIGRWVDMDHAYRTMDQDYMESVMWVFKQLWDKGLVYEGKRVSLYSWKLSTPISNFEVAMDDTYQDVNDPAITVKFRLGKNDGFPQGTSILAWTTTPWTIPANMALAVGSDIDYVLVKYDERYKDGVIDFGSGAMSDLKADGTAVLNTKEEVYLVVAKARVDSVFNRKLDHFEIVREFKGSDLVGLSYVPPFPEYYHGKYGDKNHKVYAADFATDTDGTGIVHIAPEFGDVDFGLAKKEGITVTEALDEEGRYTSEISDYVWTHYLNLEHPEQGANKINIERMKENGTLFKLEGITHRVPFCPRSNTPLVQKAQKSWFIDIQSQKEKLLEANKQINWFPEHLKFGRFAKGIESAPDWCISRTRYWGAPMPVWVGEDGEKLVVSSREEIFELNKPFGQLEKREIEGKMKYFFKGGEFDGMEFNLHKPYIDAIKLQSPKTGNTLTRISEVLDVWMDSGSMPYAQMHYPFENKTEMEQSFPADFIAEYVGQVRAWFYVMHVLGVLLNPNNESTPTPSFTNVITTGIVNGSDGRKMSKSYGNYPDPRGTIEKYGADPIRFYMLNSPLLSGGNMDFKEEGISEAIKRVILPIWNTLSFFTTYANIDSWEPSKTVVDFVRHGQTVLNVVQSTATLEEHRVSGGLNDHELTDEGRAQAKRLGEELRKNGTMYDVIVSTNMKRTDDTARIIADAIGFTGEWVMDEWFRERMVDEKHEGALWADIAREYEQKFGYKAHGGMGMYLLAEMGVAESNDDFEARTVGAYQRTLEKYAGKRVLIVSHGNTFRTVYGYAMGVHRDESLRNKMYRLANTELVHMPTVPLTNELDRYILGELQTLVAKTTDSFESYDIQKGTRAIMDFLDDLTNWYVRRSRRRFWETGMTADKQSAYETLYRVLVDLSKIIAPYCPFVSEQVFRMLTGRESVHLEYFPSFERTMVSRELQADMKKTQQLITLGLSVRGREKLRVRQPLSRVLIGENLDPYYIDILRDELNVKEVVQADMSKIARKICKPNARLIGAKFGKDVQNIIREAKAGNFVELEDSGIQVGEFVLASGEFEIAYEPLENVTGLSVEGGFGTVVALDITLTEELKLEGYARDLVRAIQDARKEAEYDVSDRIRLNISGSLADSLIASFADYITSETLSTIEPTLTSGDISKEVDLEEVKMSIVLKR